MSTLTITQNTQAGKTLVSNRFIDTYMVTANDAQIKVYLYLLRCAGNCLPTGVTDIADHFNHTENDVIRALKYWDRQHVISLLYDDQKKLAGIRLEDLDHLQEPAREMAETLSAVEEPVAVLRKEEPNPKDASAFASAGTAPAAVSAGTAPAPAAAQDFDRFSVTLDQLRDFRSREETPQLLFIVEQYLGKTLSSNDIRSLYFMTDVLHFSTDLIDYLIQYCVERGVKDFRYFEKVARSWSEAGISTPKQASAYVRKYDKNVYAIMHELGRSNEPAPKELNFIHSWVKEYGFSLDIILEACGRSVLATEKRRFEYTDGILSKWKEAGVHTIADVRSLDESRQKKDSAPATRMPASNQFNRFKQNQYDYDDLLNKIKVN